MQIVMKDLSKFISLYIRACRGRGSPDLYMVTTTEALPVGVPDHSFQTGWDERGSVSVSCGQIVSNWSFLDDLNATAVMYRHLEAKSSSEVFRAGDPHDTYIHIIAKIRTGLMDSNTSLSNSDLEDLLPDAFYGCVAEGLDHKMVVSITDDNFEESKSLYAHTGNDSSYE